MSAPIGAGDWVECIRAAGPDTFKNTLHAGAIYCVAAVEIVEGHAYLNVTGVGDGDCLWYVDRFRPLYRPRADIIESLKQPAPVREPEHA